MKLQTHESIQKDKKRNAEIFLTRVRINALKNEVMQKQGKKPLTLEQRRQIENKVQQEVLEFHFNKKMPEKYNPNEILKEYEANDAQSEQKAEGGQMTQEELYNL